jgi:hypothetical protein
VGYTDSYLDFPTKFENSNPVKISNKNRQSDKRQSIMKNVNELMLLL